MEIAFLHQSLFVDSFASASIMELLWTGNALVGLTLTQGNLREAIRDYRALGNIVNGRRTIAVNSMIVESLLILKLMAYLVAGLLAITTPGRPPTVVGMVVVTLLVFGSIALTIISWSNRRTTKYLLAHGLQNRDDRGRFIKATDQHGEDITE